MLKWNAYNGNEIFSLKEAVQDWGDVRIDPYLVWAYSTDFEYLESAKINGKDRLPLIIEMSKVYTNSNEDVAELDRILAKSDLLKFYKFFPKIKFLTARVTVPAFFNLLKSERDSKLIKRFELGLPTKIRTIDSLVSEETEIFAGLPDSRGLKRNIGPFEKLAEPPIIGIIDAGVAFLNQRFQTRDKKSRIRYLWDQNKTADNPVGRLLKRTEINDMIMECYDGQESYTTLEEMIYTREHMPNLVRRVSHGTHLLDTAAGEEPSEVTDADFKDILAVRLQQPNRQFSDTSGMWLKYSAFEALQFLILAANTVAGGSSKHIRDLVVNLSFGNLAGPHDGSSMLEKGIDFLVAESAPELPLLDNVSVHIASGNQRQAQCYANKKIDPLQSQTFHWRVLPDDATPSFLELWFDKSNEADEDIDLQNLQVEITPPVGVKPVDETMSTSDSEKFDVGNGECKVLTSDVVLTGEGEKIPVCTYVSLPKGRIATGDKPMVLIAITPTATTTSTLPAPAGTWKITLFNNSPDNSYKVDARIQRDDTTTDGVTRGRQSYFADPDYKKVDSFGYPVTPEFHQDGYVQLTDTVNGISTGEHVRTIGSYRYSGRQPVDYSGVKVGMNGNDSDNRFLHAVSEDSLMCEGVIASGTRSGSRVALNGTSVANAQATGYRFRQGEFGEDSAEEGQLQPTDEFEIESKLRRVQVRR